MAKRTVVLVSLLAAGLGWYALRSDSGPDPADDEGTARELLNRVWLDGWPRSDKDQREVLVLLDPPRKPTARVGAFVRASRWRGAFENFVYTPPRGGRIAIRYPQSGVEEIATFRLSACHGGGFTRCLDIEGNSSGTHRYRSNEDLVLRPKEAAPPGAAELLERIEAARAQAGVEP